MTVKPPKLAVREEPADADNSGWLTLTVREQELVVWQLVIDLGGEASTVPAADIPGRRLRFFPGGADRIGMCATEEVANGSLSSQTPLADFAQRWTVTGEQMGCRGCERTQPITELMHDFEHRFACVNTNAERNPWKTLASLITAQVSRS